MIAEIIQYLIFILCDLSSIAIVFAWLWFLVERFFEPSTIPYAKPTALTWLGVAMVKVIQPLHFWFFAQAFNPQTLTISACSLVISTVSFFINHQLKRFRVFALSAMAVSIINFGAMLFYSYVY